ncbi:hypothetical protein ACLOJK_011827 [Asimina triloba]
MDPRGPQGRAVIFCTSTDSLLFLVMNDRIEETPVNRPQQRHLHPHEETQAASANFYKGTLLFSGIVLYWIYLETAFCRSPQTCVGKVLADQTAVTVMIFLDNNSAFGIVAQERKDKVGERISALQELVSPYGKVIRNLPADVNMLFGCFKMKSWHSCHTADDTDTASVLLEAMGYIKFLQDQVRVLSAPYLQSVPATQELCVAIWFQESEYYSLRSRGLCLVPVEWTSKVARSNGADMWAPTMTTTKY